jgi:serine/threonine-protein kinase CLA4
VPSSSPSVSPHAAEAEAAEFALPERVEKRKLKEMVNPADPNTIFESLKRIGQGASGSVFEAVDSRDGARVAIKQMVVAAQVKPDIVRNEIELMRRCTDCPAIVSFHDAFLVSGVLWVAMELVEGCCLAELIEADEARALSEPLMAYLVRETLVALQFLHERGIVHRDIKRYVCLLFAICKLIVCVC